MWNDDTSICDTGVINANGRWRNDDIKVERWWNDDICMELWCHDMNIERRRDDNRSVW